MPSSLASRVFLLYGASLAVVLAGYLSFVYVFVFSDELEHEQTTVRTLASVMSETISEEAIVGDFDAIRGALDSALRERVAAEAVFVAASGNRLEGKRSANSDWVAPAWVESYVKSRMPRIEKAVRSGPRVYGTLYLEPPAERIAADLWTNAVVLLGVSVAFLALGLVVARVALRRWMGAVGRLDRMAHAETDKPIASADLSAWATFDGPAVPQEFQRTFGALRKTAQTLRAQRQQAEATLSAIGDGVMALDRDGRVQLANPAALATFDGSAVLGVPLAELLPELGALRLEQGWKHRSVSHTHPGMPICILDTTLSPLPGSASEASGAGYVFVMRDVTEAKVLERQLRAQVNARAAAIKSLRDALQRLTGVEPGTQAPHSDDVAVLSQLIKDLVLAREKDHRDLDNQKYALDRHAMLVLGDQNGRILSANEKFCVVSGYSEAELIGQRMQDMHAQPDGNLIQSIREALMRGEVWQGELQDRRKDGSTFWVQTTMVPLIGVEGTDNQVIAINTDISALKNAEEALQRAKESAEAANRAKSDFLANMSHEIRTPMNGIIGMTELALDTALTAEQREYLTLSRTSSEALLAILNDILDFSKIEAGHLDMERVAFKLREAVAQALDVLAVKAYDKGLELVSDVDPSVPDLLRGDPVRMRQILVNLIGNAVKFTASGEVEVSVTAESRTETQVLLKVRVRDTGIGIPANKVERLFKPFSQVDSSTTREFGGTGLGLSISQSLVRRMDGDIGVESEPGNGTTFWFTCLLDYDEPYPPAEQLLAGRRVLIVEHNTCVSSLLARYVHRWGGEAEVAADSEQAIESVLREGSIAPDLVLMAVQVKNVDGVELIGHLRALDVPFQGARVALMAPITHRINSEVLRAAGIDAVLHKPPKEQSIARKFSVLWHKARSGPVFERTLPPETLAPDTLPPLAVLLVEDNLINQQLALRLLEKLGHHVTIAGDGVEALKALHERPFDLVLMDCQMPEMDGYEATRRIRSGQTKALNPNIPVIALTANAMKGDREIALAAGMNDYLTKPLKSAELRSMLYRWMSKSSWDRTKAADFE